MIAIDRALPLAADGLQALGISDAERWLDIIQQRAETVGPRGERILLTVDDPGL